MAATNTSPSNNTVAFRLDLRVVTIVLLAALVAMLFIWKPWSQQPGANTRTVKVQGKTTIQAVPDEFVFMPRYESEGADREVALGELTTKSKDIVAKLKALGVAEHRIKTDSSAFEQWASATKPDGQTTYSLQLTVTVGAALSQKVQDYLVATAPSGQISPMARFSDTKTKELENQARSQAMKDAKAKAEHSAQELGFKVGKVKTVEDGTGFALEPYSLREGAALSTDSKLSLDVHPGENELPYSVTVTYFIR